MPWLELILLIVKGMMVAIFDTMFLIVVLFIGFQYWQMQKQQIHLFGEARHNLRLQILWAAALGIVGGLIGSFLLIVVGVTVNDIGLSYLWPVALMLALFNMRFLCFAYAGGLVALSSLLLGYPAGINVPKLIALVAILHITESILIYLSRRYSAIPVVIRQKERMIGGFMLQNSWPLPLMMLTVVGAVVPEAIEGVQTPNWWPLMGGAGHDRNGTELVYAMLPVVAALGYSDIAIASHPAEKRRKSALQWAVYSILLLVLAIVSERLYAVQYLVAIFSPVGHEILIRIGLAAEQKKEPLYVPPPTGVKILDTLHKSPAEKYGLKPGDILLTVNGWSVNDAAQLGYLIHTAYGPVELVFRRGERLLTAQLPQIARLGIIPVPEGYEQRYLEMSEGNVLKGLWQRLRAYIR